MRVAGVARGWIFLLLYPTLQLTPATLAQGDYPNAYTTLPHLFPYPPLSHMKGNYSTLEPKKKTY